MSKKDSDHSEYRHGYTDFVAYGSISDPCPDGPYRVPEQKVAYLKGWLSARTAAKLGDPITWGRREDDLVF